MLFSFLVWKKKLTKSNLKSEKVYFDSVGDKSQGEEGIVARM